MNRLQATFERLRNDNEKGLITFITAGDPDLDTSLSALHELKSAGADVLEVGVPFTDPEADGPSIQRSSERALLNDVTLCSTMDMVTQFREKDQETPIVLMGYLNPILALGYQRFAELAAESGVDGFIVVNLPPEDAVELQSHLKPAGIDLIFLVAPTTSNERVQLLAASGSGFLYYVSIKGITGAYHIDIADVDAHVSPIKQVSKLPVAVGFGIKTPDAAAAVAQVADAVVVGSVLVDLMANLRDDENRFAELHAVTRSLKQAILGP